MSLTSNITPSILIAYMHRITAPAKKKHRLETDYFHKLAMLIPSRRICCVGESHLAFHPPGALLCIFFDLLFLHLIF